MKFSGCWFIAVGVYLFCHHGTSLGLGYSIAVGVCTLIGLLCLLDTDEPEPPKKTTRTTHIASPTDLGHHDAR